MLAGPHAGLFFNITSGVLMQYRSEEWGQGSRTATYTASFNSIAGLFFHPLYPINIYDGFL